MNREDWIRVAVLLGYLIVVWLMTYYLYRILRVPLPPLGDLL